MCDARDNGRAVGVTVVLLLMAAAASGQNGATARGRFVEASSRKPLGGVSVNLRPGMDMANQWLVQNGPKPLPSFSSVTNEAGEFTIPGLQAGRYVVFAELDGYGLRAGADREIQVSDASTSVHVLEMAKAASVQGFVEDSNRRGVGGATVQLLEISGLTGARELTRAGSARTGVDGTFEIAGVPEGTYYLMATATTRSSTAQAKAGTRSVPSRYAETFYLSALELESSVPVHVTGGTDARGLRLTMREGRVFKVEGRVVGLPAGNAPARVTLRRVDRGDPGLVFAAPGVVPIQASLDSEGVFRVMDVPEGTYRIGVEGWPGFTTRTVDRDMDNVVVNIPTTLHVTGKFVGTAATVDRRLGAGGSLRGSRPSECPAPERLTWIASRQGPIGFPSFRAIRKSWRA